MQIPRRNYKKIFSFHLFSLSLSLLVLLAGLELCARFAVYGLGFYLKVLDPAYYNKVCLRDPSFQFEKWLYRHHKKFGRVQTPRNRGIFRGFSYPYAEFRNEIIINASGFRSSSDYVLNPDQLRIAVLGDSFVQALQVREKDSFPKVVQDLLAARGKDAFVFNFGMTNTGTIHQYATFLRKAMSFQPQILILAFFPNDLIDNSPYYWHSDIYLVPRYTIDPDGQVILSDFGKGKLRQNLIAGYSVTKEDGRPTPPERIFKNLDGLKNNVPFLMGPNFFSTLLNDWFAPKNDFPAAFDVYRREYPQALRESVQVTLYFIEEMQRLCSQRGTKFLVVLIPAAEQVKLFLWRDFLKARRDYLYESDFDLDMPNKIIKAQLEQRNIPCLDLLPLFRQKSSQAELYYRKDMHWNKKGHLLAGEVIADYLSRHFIM